MSQNQKFAKIWTRENYQFYIGEQTVLSILGDMLFGLKQAKVV